MSEFELDSRLATDSVLVAEGPLSQVRLMNDERFPGWCWYRAGRGDRVDRAGWRAAGQAAHRAQPRLQGPEGSDGVEKINIGALGNIVRQLHFHVIGRHDGDPAWPGPVWGSGPAHR